MTKEKFRKLLIERLKFTFPNRKNLSLKNIEKIVDTIMDDIIDYLKWGKNLGRK